MLDYDTIAGWNRSPPARKFIKFNYLLISNYDINALYTVYLKTEVTFYGIEGKHFFTIILSNNNKYKIGINIESINNC